MGAGPPADGSAPLASADPIELLRSREYLGLLVFGALIGVPVAAIAFGFLKLVDVGQEWVFSTLPDALGFDAAPTWWPLPVLVVAGLLVALTIRYLPGDGGHEPSAGLSVTGGRRPAAELPGIVAGGLRHPRLRRRGRSRRPRSSPSAAVWRR